MEGEEIRNLSFPDKEGRRLLFEWVKRKEKRKRNYVEIEELIGGLTSRPSGFEGNC